MTYAHTLLLHNSVEGLSMLQHRGQDAAGVVTCGSGGRFYQVKANGMVRDVFDPKGIQGLKGWMGVGHGQYIQSLNQTLR
jgi:amidophosphoribosyltransferase